MKKFEVEMDLHFTKTVHVQAPDEDAVIHLAEAMVLCTDALPLTNEDMIDLTATATEQDNQADPGRPSLMRRITKRKYSAAAIVPFAPSVTKTRTKRNESTNCCTSCWKP